MKNGKIVISGMGVVSSYGKGINALKSGLFSGKQNVDYLRNKNVQSCKVTLVFSNPHVPNSSLYVLEESIQEALKMAHISSINSDTSLIIGTGIGAIDILESNILNNKELSLYDMYAGRGNLSTHFAKKYNITSTVSCISTGCSSSNYAISYAQSLIQLGRCKRVICCGVEIISDIVINCFNRMNGVDSNGIKPFDKDRSGSTAGIGSATLIIETEQSALQRGINPLAEIGGFGYSCDAYNVIAPQPNGEQIKKAMRNAINSSQISTEEIAAIFAHGTGTILNDIVESNCLKEILTDDHIDVPVIGMKGNIGHTGGASNILAACAAVLAFQENIAFKTTGTKNIDPKCPINVTLKQQVINKNAIMINGFAFGGNNASIILKRYTNENKSLYC